VNRRVAVVALMALATVAPACGLSGGSSPVPSAVAPPDVVPAGAQVVQVAGATATADTCNGGQPTASLAPRGLQPPAGNMPAGSYMATIEKRGYLVAGVDQNTLLWAYRDQAGQLAGFDIDMVDQVAAAIFGANWSHHIRYVIVPNADRASAVYKGDVDIVAETMTITCGRQGFGPGAIATPVDFSTEYYDAGQAVLVPSGSSVRSAADLAGKTVCAASGSTSLSNLAALPAPPRLMSVTNQTDCLVMLQQGQVDAISTDDTILQGLAAQDPNDRILPGVRLSDEPYGMAISKSHTDFTRFVNGVLAEERSDGTWTRIWTHWLGPTVKTPAPPPPPARYRG
jgi:polar amino acid transport system substrate-binding protein